MISSQILQLNTEYVNAVEAAQVKTISNDLLVPHGVVFWGGVDSGNLRRPDSGRALCESQSDGKSSGAAAELQLRTCRVSSSSHSEKHELKVKSV